MARYRYVAWFHERTDCLYVAVGVRKTSNPHNMRILKAADFEPFSEERLFLKRADAMRNATDKAPLFGYRHIPHAKWQTALQDECPKDIKAQIVRKIRAKRIQPVEL
jgi:hypothetical protein